MSEPQKSRKVTVVVSVSLRHDQLDYIGKSITETRDRSRWIRLAIDQKIAMDKKNKGKNEGVA